KNRQKMLKNKQKKPHSRRVRKIAMKKMVSYETYHTKDTKHIYIKKKIMLKKSKKMIKDYGQFLKAIFWGSILIY
ncbi:MAG: hypothetical protein PHW92_10070, partial [Lutibacter sp.]|nr:hypothetical protein [Lutibacter sp.]